MDVPGDSIALWNSDSQKQRFNVFQVADTGNSEDRKVVPFAFVAVAGVTVETPKQVGCQTHVVKAFPAIKCVHACIACHDLLEAFAKVMNVEKRDRQPF